MEDNTTMRAAIYARVSSEQQAKANTIASQLAALKERVCADGLSLDNELCFIDEGHSGSVLVRPALERLRDAAYAGGIDRLYVHSPDRLARIRHRLDVDVPQRTALRPAPVKTAALVVALNVKVPPVRVEISSVS